MTGDNFVAQCRLGCWALGVGAGVVAMFIVASEAGFISGLMISIALAVFTALVLIQLFCWSQADAGNDEIHDSVAPPKPEPKPLSAAMTPVGTTTTSGLRAPNVPDVKVTPVPATAAKPAKAAAKKAPAKKKAAAVVTPVAQATPDYDKDGVFEGQNEGTKPEGLSAARGGKADNLKEIKGVGPKLETMLHGMGFYNFDQIAAWNAQEMAWVDANLKGFKGRASRDNWIEQAKILAAGGETEFSKRVEGGDVY